MDDDGDLNLTLIQNKAYDGDADLLDLLLGNPAIQKKFFIQTARALIFKRDDFLDLILDKNFLANSYTKYKNKIGLGDGKKYLKASQDIVLMFPFKDCVLEGGMRNEDNGKNEIFYNETLAPDEIDRLTAPKLLMNIKRITASGESQLAGFTRNENGRITDNLLIKGNNLLALHSLKQEFGGCVKLIYIDPPYNTGGVKDPFLYNNRFKRSTWLTFMKNRIEAAQKLLTHDGAMIVAIDENEQAHLGVLLKELFHQDKYEIHCITIMHNPRGIQGTNFSYTHEFAFFIIPKGMKTIGNRKIEQADIVWRNLRDNGGISLRSDARNCFYPIIVENNKIVDFGDVVIDDDMHPQQTEKKDNRYYIYPVDKEGIERKWRYARQSVEAVKHLLRVEPKGDSYEIEIGKDFGMYRTVWVDKRYDANEYGTKLIKSLVPNCPFSFPKSL